MNQYCNARLAGLALGAFAVIGISTDAAGQTSSFGYECQDCPANWGNLPGFEACRDGTAQSPIAFDRSSPGRRPTPVLLIGYDDSPLEVERKETNFEGFVEEGSSVIRLGRTVLELLQFHFHSTSEHVIDGERAALEWHFVHQSESAQLAVIGVFVVEGEHFDEIDPLIAALPAIAATPVGGTVDVPEVEIDALLPDDISSYRYTGSTTTPPCTPDVSWILLRQTVEFSKSQIEAIQETLRDINGGFDNNRPIEERNGRVIRVDFFNDDDDDDDDDHDGGDGDD